MIVSWGTLKISSKYFSNIAATSITTIEFLPEDKNAYKGAAMEEKATFLPPMPSKGDLNRVSS